METVALIAPGEGTWTGASGTPYRAQAASGLRVDALPQDAPGLVARGFVSADAVPAADLPPVEPAIAESSDSAGGAAV